MLKFFSHHADSSHADLVSKVLKESFADEHKQYYLETYLKQGSPLSETLVPVLQQLLDAKVRLDEGECLQHNCIHVTIPKTLPALTQSSLVEIEVS